MNALFNDPLATAAMAILLAGIGLLLIGLHHRRQLTPLRDRLLGTAQAEQAPRQADDILRGQGLQLPPRLLALLLPVARFGESLAGTANDRQKLRRLLIMAGFRSQEALGLLMAGKYALGLLLALVVLFGILEPGSRMGLNGLAGGLLALFAGTTLPEVGLKMRSAQRGERLERNLPDGLDLMVICAEAGLPLGRVLQVVAKELVLSAPELADELRYTYAELQILSDRPRALLNLAERTGVSGIESMVATLIQAERYGTPLSQALRTISEESRKTLILTLEERAGKLPAQLSVPLMTLILPPIVAMMGAPAMVRVIRLLSQ
ncbi:type II secretion system F family protein [Pseudomonas sp. MM211]|uniref:type II secretion system F family protein n=1 Tax=Pseudomonas sp. MM211 TaxID=2866808 RepID=UPI001CEDAFD8|nr:type II secretion system F family protein [Pseudomonas sp. MM211]UCJ16340.1 type II secretion system F family protein [Pseudomonas sp. MM211]